MEFDEILERKLQIGKSVRILIENLNRQIDLADELKISVRVIQNMSLGGKNSKITCIVSETNKF